MSPFRRTGGDQGRAFRCVHGSRLFDGMIWSEVSCMLCRRVLKASGPVGTKGSWPVLEDLRLSEGALRPEASEIHARASTTKPRSK